MKTSKQFLLLLAATAFLVAPVAFAEDLNVETKVNLGVNQNNEQPTRSSTEVRADIKATLTTRNKERAAQEIDRRIEGLTKQKVRIQEIKRVSDTTKTNLAGEIDIQIALLTSLKAKIAGDTDEVTLKADVTSITKSYRIYMLVMPQAAVAATVDRIKTSAEIMMTFGTKLQERINLVGATGTDVSTWQSAMTEYNAKVLDAKVQADAALALTIGLTPDNGDTATMEKNKKALTDARAKIKLATDDLHAARKNAETIVKGIKALNVKTEIKSETETKTEQS